MSCHLGVANRSSNRALALGEDCETNCQMPQMIERGEEILEGTCLRCLLRRLLEISRVSLRMIGQEDLPLVSRVLIQMLRQEDPLSGWVEGMKGHRQLTGTREAAYHESRQFDGICCKVFCVCHLQFFISLQNCKLSWTMTTLSQERLLSFPVWLITNMANPPLGVEVIWEFQEFQEFKTTQSN